MKKIFLYILCLLSLNLLAQNDSDIPDKPVPARLVNDYTGTLTELQKQALEQKLVAYDDSTSSQIAIVIIRSTGNYDIADYGLKLGRKWGVGGAEFRNGVIIIVALDDRKTRIEVGYGLEGAIPDITAKSIIDNSLTPNFREGNYYRGLDNAVDDIIEAAKGEYKAPAGYNDKKSRKGPGLGSIIFFIILILLFSGMGGGRGGRRRGGFMSSAGWIIGSILSNSGRGGGGFSGGGGWSGGGGGGGGFGGFGGGSFGGGGASGSW
jgi:uncharacterized protein